MNPIQIRRGSGVPLYKQIQQYIRDKIESAEWNVGFQIPTEQMLCEQFRVSRITVVKALHRLVEEGLLRKEQGRGTFVTNAAMAPEPLTLRSFTEEMRLRGMKPGNFILSKQIVYPTPFLSERLRLEKGQTIWRIERLLTADGNPVGIQRNHLPVHRFPNLGDELTDGSSLYGLLSSAYRVVPDSAIETYRSVQSDEEESNLLQVPVASAAFAVERLTYSENIPFEFVRSVMRSDQFSYTVRLTSPARAADDS